MVVVSDQARLWLRRFEDLNNKGSCPSARGYHEAMVDFGCQPLRPRYDEANKLVCYDAYDDLGPPMDDPRWPTHCECGYQFTNQDHPQVYYDVLYKLPDGTMTTLQDLPPGAMWDAPWLEPLALNQYPDRVTLHVRLPNGADWFVDGPASNNPHGWTRTGVLPAVTVQGSIMSHNKPAYHGFLNHGVLEEC